MSKTYSCYLHKPGAMAPELRILNCESEQDLPHVIGSQLATWGEVEKMDIYDEADRPVLTFAPTDRAPH